MDQEILDYCKELPWFLGFVLSGIGVNLIWHKYVRRGKLNRTRIIRELISGIWISAVTILILDNFVDWTTASLYAIASVIGFLNSKIIGYLGKNLVEAVFTRLISSVGKGDNNYYEEPDEYTGDDDIEEGKDNIH